MKIDISFINNVGIKSCPVIGTVRDNLGRDVPNWNEPHLVAWKAKVVEFIAKREPSVHVTFEKVNFGGFAELQTRIAVKGRYAENIDGLEDRLKGRNGDLCFQQRSQDYPSGGCSWDAVEELVITHGDTIVATLEAKTSGGIKGRHGV